MAINYNKVGWNTTSYVNPTNMNQMDNGIKAACDGVDAIDETIGDTSTLPSPSDDLCTNISEVNSKLANKMSVKAPEDTLGGSTDFNTITTIGEYGCVAYASNLVNVPSVISGYGAKACRIKLTVYEIGTPATKSLCQRLECINTDNGKFTTHERIQIAAQWKEWQ